MKSNLLLVGAMFYCSLSNGQGVGNVFPTGVNTNVGIGTTSPSTKLQITSATSGTSGLRLTNLTNASPTVTSNRKGLSVDGVGNVILVPTNVEPSLFAINNASGATSSADYLAKSHVFGSGKGTSYSGWSAPIVRYGFNVFDMFKAPGYMNSEWILVNIVDRAGKERVSFQATKDESGIPGATLMTLKDGMENELFKVSDELPNNTFLHMPKSNSRIVIGNWGNYLPEHKFVVGNGSSYFSGNLLANSNIGIGTDSFTDGSDTYRLSVEGAIRAHRVKVYTTWADYVFEKDYKLPTLREVELYIAQNGHLKDIPSAKTVEANGIELGEMNKLLLQKIEELTLYVIELNKEMEELKSKIKD